MQFSIECFHFVDWNCSLDSIMSKMLSKSLLNHFDKFNLPEFTSSKYFWVFLGVRPRNSGFFFISQLSTQYVLWEILIILIEKSDVSLGHRHLFSCEIMKVVNFVIPTISYYLFSYTVLHTTMKVICRHIVKTQIVAWVEREWMLPTNNWSQLSLDIHG